MRCAEEMPVLEVCPPYPSLEWLQWSCLFYVCVYDAGGGGASFLVYKIKVAAAFNRNNFFFPCNPNPDVEFQLYPGLLALVQAPLVHACS